MARADPQNGQNASLLPSVTSIVPTQPGQEGQIADPARCSLFLTSVKRTDNSPAAHHRK